MSSVLVGNFDTSELLVVVSGRFSVNFEGCSLLGSVLLSEFNTTVTGTNFAVVVSGFGDDDAWLAATVTFW